MNLTFIGMPGSGKSCMGRVISKKLKMKFIDGDKLIERKYSKKLNELIDEVGLEEFKKIEEETLLSITGDNLVISPGGSAVYYDRAMRHFKQMGIVVYLSVSPKVLIARLGDFSKRGIVLKDGQTIEDLHSERVPLMEKYADITLNCDGDAYVKYQRELMDKLKKYL